MRMLRTTGFSVVGEAETCAAAMDAALDLRPRAILVDVRLPDGNGIELARKLRALPWRPRVLLTSSDPEAAAEVADGYGEAVAFVAKADLPTAALPSLLGACHDT